MRSAVFVIGLSFAQKSYNYYDKQFVVNKLSTNIFIANPR